MSVIKKIKGELLKHIVVEMCADNTLQKEILELM